MLTAMIGFLGSSLLMFFPFIVAHQPAEGAMTFLAGLFGMTALAVGIMKPNVRWLASAVGYASIFASFYSYWAYTSSVWFAAIHVVGSLTLVAGGMQFFKEAPQPEAVQSPVPAARAARLVPAKTHA